MFDSSFASQTWPGAFTDPGLPKGYAPFGIQNLKGLIFVTYAKTQPGSNDEAPRPGPGRRRRLPDRRDVLRPRGPGRRAGMRRGASPGPRVTSVGSAATSSSATSATARSMPSPGAAMAGIRTASSVAITASRSGSTACGASPSVAARRTTARRTPCSSRPARTTKRRVRSARSPRRTERRRQSWSGVGRCRPRFASRLGGRSDLANAGETRDSYASSARGRAVAPR